VISCSTTNTARSSCTSGSGSVTGNGTMSLQATWSGTLSTPARWYASVECK
jgi:hypothetical protein